MNCTLYSFFHGDLYDTGFDILPLSLQIYPHHFILPHALQLLVGIRRWEMGEVEVFFSPCSLPAGSSWFNCVVLLKPAGEGNGTPLQYSCLENPMDGGAWKAAVHGVTEG